MQMSIESPCIRNCCLDKQDICLGCGRTIEEIICWGDTDNVGREKILTESEKRLKGIKHHSK